MIPHLEGMQLLDEQVAVVNRTQSTPPSKINPGSPPKAKSPVPLNDMNIHLLGFQVTREKKVKSINFYFTMVPLRKKY